MLEVWRKHKGEREHHIVYGVLDMASIGFLGWTEGLQGGSLSLCGFWWRADNLDLL